MVAVTAKCINWGSVSSDDATYANYFLESLLKLDTNRRWGKSRKTKRNTKRNSIWGHKTGNKVNQWLAFIDDNDRGERFS